jgi:hypothetical protein
MKRFHSSKITAVKLRSQLQIFTVLSFICLFACTTMGDKKAKPGEAIKGLWSFDSLSFGRDSNALPFEYGLYALVLYDSIKTSFRFDRDSVYTLLGDSVTESTAYGVQQDSMLVLGDGSGTTFHLAITHKDRVVLSKRDTISLFLTKRIDR